MGTTELQRFIDDKSLVALRKFAEIELEFKRAKEQHEIAMEQIKEGMIQNSVEKLEGDWGTITLTERITYKAEDLEDVEDLYLKPALDTQKVKAQATLTGNLPAGVIENRTKFLTKKLR